MVPSLGNLDAYIAAVHRIPLLGADEELQLARSLRDRGDVQAAGRLVLSHLRLVVSLSRQYLGYGLPQGDLIQEGNVGLMKAVKRFDPDQGVRLVSYAMHWIKAEIQEYILRNWRLVKVATTKAQRKLFFNLRSRKQNLLQQKVTGEGEYSARMALTAEQILDIARDLDVKPEEVREMETRMAGGDIALEPLGDDVEDGIVMAPIAYLADDRHEPTRTLEAKQRAHLAGPGLLSALDCLDERSRHIVESRWLHPDGEDGGGKTLHQLAADYGVSAERIRQIETTALKKMRKVLESSPG